MMTDEEQLSLEEEFIRAAYKKGLLPAIVTDYDTFVEAYDNSDANHVRMRAKPRIIPLP